MVNMQCIQADITRQNVDAIVNAANTSLLGGGGVDGAIHRAAGTELLEACRLLNGCKTGQAKITNGFKLPAKYIIHTVGPVWNGGRHNEVAMLAACYTNSLRLADDNGVASIAFPNISTGVYGFPKKLACETAVAAVKNYLETSGTNLSVSFVCYDAENLQLYQQELNKG